MFKISGGNKFFLIEEVQYWLALQWVSGCEAPFCEVVLYCLSTSLCSPHYSALFCRRCFLPLKGLLGLRTCTAQTALSTCGTCSESRPLRPMLLVCVPTRFCYVVLQTTWFRLRRPASFFRDFWVHLLTMFFLHSIRSQFGAVSFETALSK